ncbi:hypothetical protein Droror1_Dr00024564 [Drosera rotundifolia]
MASKQISTSKYKAQWSPSAHKCFLDLCVEETSKGNRPGPTFNKDGWRNILESLNKRLGFNIDRKQLKNHWDSTRSKWKAWSKLICTDSMKWDPTTRQFGANEEEWASYIQANPDAALLRYKAFEHTDQLEIIFSGVAGQGEDEVSERPTQRIKHDKNILITNLSDVEPKDVEPERIEPLCEAVESRPQNEHPDKGERQLDAVESRSAVTVQSIQGERSYSIGKCIECLDGMLEVEQGSELYLFALDIFLKKEYREIFLQLKKPSVRIAWLKRLQSVGMQR